MLVSNEEIVAVHWVVGPKGRPGEISSFGPVTLHCVCIMINDHTVSETLIQWLRDPSEVGLLDRSTSITDNESHYI